MGVNARWSDAPSQLVKRITKNREDKENAVRDSVRSGAMSLDNYLIEFKGFSREHAEKLKPQFHKAIFG